MGKVEGYKLYIDNEKWQKQIQRLHLLNITQREDTIPRKYMWKLICSMDQLFILIFTLSL